MAIRGRKPAYQRRRITGSHIKDRPPPKAPEAVVISGGPIERPPALRINSIAGKLWQQYIARCHWLTWADSCKAFMWCQLQAEYQKAPEKMIASRIAQLRALGSELGFDYTSRERMGITIPTAARQIEPSAEKSPKVATEVPAEKYLK